MQRLRGLGWKTLAVGLLAFIVIGGFAVGLLETNGGGESVGLVPTAAPFGTPSQNGTYFMASGAASDSVNGLGTSLAGLATVTTMSTTTVVAPQTTVIGTSTGKPSPQAQAAGATANGTRMVEFFSNLTMESPTPSSLASRIIGTAYSVGGYVAYQSTLKDSAYVVVRVPAASYEQTLSEVESMGNVTSIVSTSNDVTVQYTNLNATLVSLEAEQQALLRLIGTTTRVNDTLAIEAKLQSVNAQINFVQSEMLQTQRLVAFSTMTVSISRAAQPKPLAMTLSATPKSGVSPLGVTFNAVVSGGRGPYVVNYNFGDGSSQQGRILIHQFYQAGDYNVTVSATDSTGNVTMASVMVHVSPAPSMVGFGNFPATLGDLFVRVLEGIATVAVVVLPPAAVLAVVVLPLRKRKRVRAEPQQG